MSLGRVIRRSFVVCAAQLGLIIGVLVGTAFTAPPAGAAAPYPTGDGYWLAATDGGMFSFGQAQFQGSTGAIHLKQPIVGGTPLPFLEGYWLVASDGGIFSFGSANFYGSTGALTLNQPIVGMASHPSGAGYWLVATDGGIFSFGASTFFGSTGSLVLNKPIVGMAATPTGKGYWLVASDGGIFSFGDARFFGSTGNIQLNKPIVGMAATPTGQGYWLVASDGGIFSFGDARFFGSTGSIRLNRPIVGMTTNNRGDGYQLVATDGGVFTFGHMSFFGSTGALRLNAPIRTIMLRPSPAVSVDAYVHSASQSSDWMGGVNGFQLQMTKTGTDNVPAGARVRGVEGFTVGQLGKIGFTSVNGLCDGSTPYFLLEATNDGGGTDQGTYACKTAGAVNTFDPVAGTGGPALPAGDVVNSLDIVQPRAGTAALTNVTIGGAFGVTVADFRTYRADGTIAS